MWAPAEEIFPGRTLKFGRRFERVEKNFNFSTRNPGHLHACTHECMAQFVLRIDFWYNTWGQALKSKWHLVTVSIPDYGSCSDSKTKG